MSEAYRGASARCRSGSGRTCSLDADPADRDLVGVSTLLAGAMRACLLTLLELFAYFVMRRIHRGRLPSYQYQSGKIESFLNC